MKLATYLSAEGPRVGVIVKDGLVDVHSLDSSLPLTLAELLARGPAALQKLGEAAGKGQAVPLNSVKLLAPIPKPGKVFCIGLNYADHARETGKEPPPEPVVFNKFTSCVIATGEPIVVPKVCKKVDYEAELVVVIGKGGKHIAESEAMTHVAGYACGHDVSGRDWQTEKPGGQWLLGKSFDTFAPLGPYLVTADEIPEPGNLRVQFRLNGQTLQDSTTAQLIFSVPKLIAYLSQVVALSPGDVIYTGTPPGVGAARKPPVFMKPGDVAEVEIEGLGVLSNPVVAEA
ncbi:MAG TPA: fumarylacetoacetate hydrolase family protein [Pirellulales bacterium]